MDVIVYVDNVTVLQQYYFFFFFCATVHNMNFNFSHCQLLIISEYSIICFQ